MFRLGSGIPFAQSVFICLRKKSDPRLARRAHATKKFHFSLVAFCGPLEQPNTYLSKLGIFLSQSPPTIGKPVTTGHLEIANCVSDMCESGARRQNPCVGFTAPAQFGPLKMSHPFFLHFLPKKLKPTLNNSSSGNPLLHYFSPFETIYCTLLSFRGCYFQVHPPAPGLYGTPI
jgi:hypothetical protein